FAAQELSTLADRRHDDAAATDYAQRAAKAGEDYVRFNPADLTTWAWWATGMGQVEHMQYERGEIRQAIATRRAQLALAEDPRRPSSLGPVLWFRPLMLADLLSRLGEKTEAEKTAQLFQRYRDEATAQFAPEDPRHELFASSTQLVNAMLALNSGDDRTALAD